MQYIERVFVQNQLQSTPQQSSIMFPIMHEGPQRAVHLSPPQASPIHASMCLHEDSVIAASPPSFALSPPEGDKQPTAKREEREGWSASLLFVILFSIAFLAFLIAVVFGGRAAYKGVHQGRLNNDICCLVPRDQSFTY